MFTAKKTSLFERPTSGASQTAKSPFIQAGMKKAATTTSLGNGAIKLTTTGNDFVDDFGKISNYKAPRTFAEISKTMQLLWSQSPLKTLCILFYIRMITRVVQFFDGSKTTVSQRGQGLKHEGIFRMMWVAINYPSSFWKNITLFISIGGWKDVITMLQYDLVYNGWKDRKLDWDKFGTLILAGLENPNTSELVKKYLPTIKSTKQCNTVESQADNLIGKWICSLLFGNKGEESGHTYKKYRKLKSSGTAHEWQQLISRKQLVRINFDTIHGRALAQLVSGKFLKNNQLETKYAEWIATKPVAKYTGYVYELFKGVNSANQLQKSTIDKQFLNLIEVAKNGMKEGDTGLIVVVDSSGSMSSNAIGTKVSAYEIAKSFALYFSYLLKGDFENTWLEFSHSTVMKQWKGTTPTDKYLNEHSRRTESTNFLSVADHFIKILEMGVKEADFPNGILCVSDGCFNNSGHNKSETQALKQRLLKGGFSKKFVEDFKIILWDIPNVYYNSKGQTAFEDFADCPNLYHMSGLDGSAIAFLTGVEGQKIAPTNSEMLFEAAMNQECLNRIEV